MSLYGVSKKASERHVEQLLTLYDAQKIAVGHTLTKHIGFDFNDKVIRVDVDHGAGESEALLIENHAIFRVSLIGQASVNSNRKCRIIIDIKTANIRINSSTTLTEITNTIIRNCSWKPQSGRSSNLAGGLAFGLSIGLSLGSLSMLKSPKASN